MSNPGQSNYGAAKSGIATFSQILAKELVRYGVKSNCIAPAARTRLTLATPGLDEIMAAKEGAFDEWDPKNVSPLVCYLASADCAFNGETFFVQGGTVKRVKSWEMAETVEQHETWSRRRARRGAGQGAADLGLRVSEARLSAHSGAGVASVAGVASGAGGESGGGASDVDAVPAAGGSSAGGGRSVIALISSPIWRVASSVGIAVCSAISFIMSPCTVTLPVMNACIPAAGSWSTYRIRAVS